MPRKNRKKGAPLTDKQKRNIIKKLINGEDLERIKDNYLLTIEDLADIIKGIFLEPEVYLPDVLEEVFDKKDAEIQLYRKKCNELKNKLARYDMIFENLELHIKAYREPKYEPIKISKTSREFHPVLIISDAHIGETINLDFFKYDIDVSWSVAKKIVKETLYALQSRSYDENITIFILGDMVSGIIHDELLKHSIVPVEQIVESGKIMAYIANELSRYRKQVNVFAVVGNHGRFFKKPYYKEKYNNLDYLAYKIAELYTRDNSRIKWYLPKHSFSIVNIKGFNFFLHHGDNIRSWAGIPYYGINRANMNYTATMLRTSNIVINYFIRGHFHSVMSGEAPLGQTYTNGTWKPYDEYGHEKASSFPSDIQLFLSVNEDLGVSSVDYIKLYDNFPKKHHLIKY